MIIKRKLYSKYDETDEIKRMKDSDILDAKEKEVDKKGNLTDTLKKTGRKAVIGGIIGGGLGLLGKDKSKALRYMKLGAGIGGGLGLAESISQHKDENDDVEFYNRRLKYAKKHARRREAADWRQNMTQREGYSY